MLHGTTTDISLELLLGPQLEAFAAAGWDVIGASAPGEHVAALEARGIRHVPVRHLTLTHAVERLRLATPFRISGYTFSEGSVALVTLTDDGLTGRGEANGVYYFNDDAESICRTIETNREVIERGITREELATLLPAGGARNALGALANVMGFPAGQTLSLVAPPAELPDAGFQREVAALIAEAEVRRPDLKAAEAQVKAAQAGVDGDRGGRQHALDALGGDVAAAHRFARDQPAPAHDAADFFWFSLPGVGQNGLVHRPGYPD